MRKELIDLGVKGTELMRKNGPVAAIVLGIGLGIGAAILASKETPHYIEARKSMHEATEEVTKTDEVKCFMKHYWKPIAIEALSIASIATGTKMNLDKISALSAACVLSDKAYRELNDRLTDALGEVKAAEVKKSMVEDHAQTAADAITNNSKLDEDVIEHTGYGTQLCWFDPIGKLFRCDRKVVEKAELALSHRLLDEHWITINDFLSEINLRPIGGNSGAGELVGWDVWKCKSLDFKYSYIEAPNSGEPMLCIYSDTCVRSCR